MTFIASAGASPTTRSGDKLAQASRTTSRDRADLDIVGRRRPRRVGEAHPPEAGHHRFLDLGGQPARERGDARHLALPKHVADQRAVVRAEIGDVEQAIARSRLLPRQRVDQFGQ